MEGHNNEQNSDSSQLFRVNKTKAMLERNTLYATKERLSKMSASKTPHFIYWVCLIVNISLCTFFITLVCISSISTDAEIQIEKSWVFTTGKKPKGMPWLTKNPVKHHKAILGPIYPYAAPFYEGGRWLSLFIPFQIGNHHVWFDPGSIVLGCSGGYRYVFDKPYWGQHWFSGFYVSHNYYGRYFLSNINGSGDLKDLIETPKHFFIGGFGLELGSSTLGQLTINFHGVLDRGLYNITQTVRTYSYYNQSLREIDIIDNAGFSAKWVSIPNVKGIQFNSTLAYTQAQKKIEGEDNFAPEYLWRLRAGLEFNINTWAKMEVQWTLDKYQSFSFIPSMGIKCSGVDSSSEKDKFQGRLRRPPQYHMPLYTNFSWCDFLAVWGSERECGCCYRQVLLKVPCCEEIECVCFECIKGVIQTKNLEENGLKFCAEENCTATISLKDLRVVLGERRAQDMETKRLIAVAKEAGIDITICPFCKECVEYTPFRGSNDFHCACGITSCLKCCKVAHPGSTCEQARKNALTARARIEEAMNKAALPHCPHKDCGVPVERISACNHLICTQCREAGRGQIDICDWCGADITGGPVLSNHYSDRDHNKCPTYPSMATERQKIRQRAQREQRRREARANEINTMIAEGLINSSQRAQYERIGVDSINSPPSTTGPNAGAQRGPNRPVNYANDHFFYNRIWGGRGFN